MFPDSDSPREGAKKDTPAKGLRKNFLLYGVIAVIGLLAATAVALAIGLSKAQAVKVPDEINQKFEPTIYLPSKLPGKYKVDAATFSLAEDNTVLLFNAKDGVSGDLVFSQQAKPKDFDFDRFHQGNFENPQTLSNTPHPSVWGKAAGGRLTLSIVTDDTWIMMATSAPLNQGDLFRIASSIKR